MALQHHYEILCTEAYTRASLIEVSGEFLVFQLETFASKGLRDTGRAPIVVTIETCPDADNENKAQVIYSFLKDHFPHLSNALDV